MLTLPSYFLLALSSAVVLASTDLRNHLHSAGISAVFPGESGYSSASSAFNLRFNFTPAAVTFPSSQKEVSEIVKACVEQKLQVVARSGGHSYIANGLGGQNGALVVDLRNLTKVTVDTSTGTAVIETGNRLGTIASALSNHGRALPHGTCPYVGIGGHSGYGGFGFTSRMWGLTLDAILSVELVLADGSIVTASETEHSDLFWAIRGSAGSFGITTSIKVNTFPAPPSATVFRYDWSLGVADTAQVLATFQSFVQTNIPPQLGGEINFARGPIQGNISFSFLGGWYGPASQLNSTLAPFLSRVPKPQHITLVVGSYINSVTYLAGGSLDTYTAPDGHDTFYAKSLMTPEGSPMSPAALTAFANYLAYEGFVSKTEWFAQLELYGGKNSAINAVEHDATAFAHRTSTFTMQFYASSPGRTPPYPQYGFSFLNGMVNSITSNSPQDWDYGAYPNYIDDKLIDWSKLYYNTNYARLQSLKITYDPKDVFAFPTSIEEQ